MSTIADAGEGRRGRVEVRGFQVESIFPRSSFGTFAVVGIVVVGVASGAGYSTATIFDLLRPE